MRKSLDMSIFFISGTSSFFLNVGDGMNILPRPSRKEFWVEILRISLTITIILGCTEFIWTPSNIILSCLYSKNYNSGEGKWRTSPSKNFCFSWIHLGNGILLRGLVLITRKLIPSPLFIIFLFVPQNTSHLISSSSSPFPFPVCQHRNPCLALDT